jgi:hypothetical protein
VLDPHHSASVRVALQVCIPPFENIRNDSEASGSSALPSTGDASVPRKTWQCVVSHSGRSPWRSRALSTLCAMTRASASRAAPPAVSSSARRTDAV